jgi:hypothetical protein
MLGWIGIYFVGFSLAILLLIYMTIQPAETGMEAIGAGIYVIFVTAALLNLVIGGILIGVSLWLKRSPWFADWRRRAIVCFFLSSVLYVILGCGGMGSMILLLDNWQNWYYGWKMPQVNMGDTRQRVEQLVGRASSQWECDSPYANEYSFATNLSTCKTVSLYPYRSPATLSQWEIAYDGGDGSAARLGDRVVAKHNAVVVYENGKPVLQLR